LLPFFFHSDLSTNNAVFSLSEEASKHCVQVLRMKIGDQMHLTNGAGLKALVSITEAHKKNTVVTMASYHEEEYTQQKNSIAISLVKNNTRFEWFLEKATELGVYEIVPLLCKRTERTFFKKERYHSIIISAMLQSQQTFLPILQEPVAFEKYIQSVPQKNKFIAHCVDIEKNAFQSVLQKNEDQVILIGPEGDFDEKEIELALKKEFRPVSLGNTRLRTETAGLVAATLFHC
jgi:16S rRNA (uracil1498-N3)-methyltransferase